MVIIPTSIGFGDALNDFMVGEVTLIKEEFCTTPLRVAFKKSLNVPPVFPAVKTTGFPEVELSVPSEGLVSDHA